MPLTDTSIFKHENLLQECYILTFICLFFLFKTVAGTSCKDLRAAGLTLSGSYSLKVNSYTFKVK